MCLWVLVWPRGGLWVESSDVGLWGYPESPIRGVCLDDGETLDRPKHTFTHKSLSSVNPTYTTTNCNNLGNSHTSGEVERGFTSGVSSGTRFLTSGRTKNTNFLDNLIPAFSSSFHRQRGSRIYLLGEWVISFSIIRSFSLFHTSTSLQFSSGFTLPFNMFCGFVGDGGGLASGMSVL